ncbi:preprotein translocase subunit SecA [soil metagenome]
MDSRIAAPQPATQAARDQSRSPSRSPSRTAPGCPPAPPFAFAVERRGALAFSPRPRNLAGDPTGPRHAVSPAVRFSRFPKAFRMVQWLIKKIVGSKNQRELKRLWPVVQRINELEEELQNQPESVLQEKTAAWKERLSAIEDLDEQAKALEEIMPEAFAVVKNAARRLFGSEFTACDQPMVWEMVHFDVQLIGGIGLHTGSIAEMATGEGKTLVATLPVYLNALTGRGVHLVTVNDYLARRDSEWMGHLYGYLGLSCGCIQNDQPPDLRRQQYGKDITYGTNSEFGFDYLRDNGMAQSKELRVQRGHYYAIVDEVDSVLIDEARTPLIISGPSTVSTHQFDKFRPLIDQLVKKQNVLCNGLAQDAKKAFDAGELVDAGHLMFKVKLGQPRNRQLLRLMETPELRRAMDKAELTFYQDPQKTELFKLKEELYYTIDEKSNEAELSELGRTYLNPDDPEAFTLPDIGTAFADIDANHDLDSAAKNEQKQALQNKLDHQSQRIHNITQLLKAYCLYEKDVHYVVTDNKVVIVDENTGREMPGRRWGDGLHQAVEAKEMVKIDRETQTLATITIQNYFRLYEKLAGMTGTAETDAAEFKDIYGLEVLNIPTNRPIARVDQNDAIYKTRREKYNAVINTIKERHAKGQPILVGTASVEASETVARMLKREKIPHTVLNAKFHRQEAEIVARAGLKGAVTVSTNMAGRGTDIKLGEGIPELGGLFVCATERHQSRRIDRQLRGRCARQGDPGESKFFISFEDELMMNFGASERMTKMMERFGLEEGQELEHPWLNKSVETAQKRVEQRNYTWRKRILDYDDVMNKQREVVYSYRTEIIDTDTPRDLIMEVIDEAIPLKVEEFVPEGSSEEEQNEDGLVQWINGTFPLAVDLKESGYVTMTGEEISADLIKRIKKAYDIKIQGLHPNGLVTLERLILLTAIDKLWQEHLYSMDALREGVGLRSYGQKDPLVEYKNEAYAMFEVLMENIRFEALGNIFRGPAGLQEFERFLASIPQRLTHDGSEGAAPGAGTPAQGRPVHRPGGTMTMSSGALPPLREEDKPKLIIPKKTAAVPAGDEKVGRNDPCPCGSGKKFKNCCGRVA